MLISLLKRKKLFFVLAWCGQTLIKSRYFLHIFERSLFNLDTIPAKSFIQFSGNQLKSLLCNKSAKYYLETFMLLRQKPGRVYIEKSHSRKLRFLTIFISFIASKFISDHSFTAWKSTPKPTFWYGIHPQNSP